MNTSRSGCCRIAGMRRVSQTCRASLTQPRRRSVATSDFFICEPEAGQQRSDRGMMNRDALRCRQGIAQLEKRDVRVLVHQLYEKGLIRRQLALARRASLTRRLILITGNWQRMSVS